MGEVISSGRFASKNLLLKDPELLSDSFLSDPATPSVKRANYSWEELGDRIGDKAGVLDLMNVKLLGCKYMILYVCVCLLICFLVTCNVISLYCCVRAY